MIKRLIILPALIILIILLLLIFAIPNFIKINDNFFVSIREEEKIFLKKIGKKVKNIIYREATEHNPEGDFMPDQIDDEIISEIKKRVN